MRASVEALFGMQNNSYRESQKRWAAIVKHCLIYQANLVVICVMINTSPFIK